MHTPHFAVLVLASLLATPVLGVAASERQSKWGAEVSSQECASRGNHRLHDILSGKVEPYAFTGPPEPECTADGCRHEYWGSRCRWKGVRSAACPKETRDQLVGMLKDFARKGSEWAADALTLQPCEVFEQIKGHTLWFAGDSISQETANAFVCFLLEYMVVTDSPPKVTNDTTLNHRLTHNANNVEMTTWCAMLQEDTRVCMLRVNFGPRMANVMLPALAQLASPFDVVVLNFGLWSNSMDELKLHVSMFESAFEFHRHLLPNRTFWRETSAQHYSTLNGMYNSDIPIKDQTCQPIYPGVNLTITTAGTIIPSPGQPLPTQYSPEAWELNVVLNGGLRNAATQPAIDRLGLHTIRTWNTSLALADYHHHTHLPDEPSACAKRDCDCTHSCQPSWSQIWLPSFYKAIGDNRRFMTGGRQAPWLEPGSPQLVEARRT